MTDQPVILFDGICNLCNRSIQYVIKNDKPASFKFASLQSATGRKLLKEFNLPGNELNSFVLIQDNKAYTRSTAALKVIKKLKGPVKLLYGFIIVPSFIRDAVYKLIAKNRYNWFGKKTECMIPTPELQNRFIN